MKRELTFKQAWGLIGGLGQASKMPGYTYGLSAEKCKTGSTLALVKNSPCSHCYALSGHYVRPSVIRAHRKRLASLRDPRWVEAFCVVLRKIGKHHPHFRWHDSGDIQNFAHLQKIIQIAKNLPEISFWLPTQERGIISFALKIGVKIPDNLTIRISSPKLNLRKELEAFGLPMSSVREKDMDRPRGVNICPAPQQGGKCGACRNCWDKSVKWVSYLEH